jgi:branched-chain amino acid transport system permease protein
MLIGLQIISGLVSAAVLFLLAAGLTLIFGICHVLNLAHGAFFMLALFLTYSATVAMAESWNAGFWVALAVVPLISAALGAAVEILLFRRIYKADILVQVLPTIGLIYIIGDVVRFFWGLTSKSVPLPDMFAVPLEVFGVFFPAYYGFIISSGAAVAILVWWIVYRTQWGLLLRAASQDRDMSTALGVDSGRLFTSVFALAMWLAGIAGVLYAPIGGANLGSDMDAVIEAFAVVVVGGLGSVWGSLVAAVIIGLMKAFGILVVPQFAMAFVFAVMALVLIIRPTGLFGARD